MSIPRNHHFVSRVLSNKFLSLENQLFKYSITSRKITALNSTKSLFSQRDLNSKLEDDGTINHNSVEETLSMHFEKDFPKHYKVIMDMLKSGYEIGKPIANSEEITSALSEIMNMGFIGRMRHPQYMLESESAIFGPLLEIAKYATPELRNEIYSSYNRQKVVTNKIPQDYASLSQGLAKLMGEVTYSIMLAADDHFFFLPDCTAATKRFKMKDDIIDGKVFINPAMPIGLVIMPINSKVLIVALAENLLEERQHGIYPLNAETTKEYNKILLDNAYDEIVCENLGYLKKFLNIDSKSQA